MKRTRNIFFVKIGFPETRSATRSNVCRRRKKIEAGATRSTAELGPRCGQNRTAVCKSETLSSRRSSTTTITWRCIRGGRLIRQNRRGNHCCRKIGTMTVVKVRVENLILQFFVAKIEEHIFETKKWLNNFKHIQNSGHDGPLFERAPAPPAHKSRSSSSNFSGNNKPAAEMLQSRVYDDILDSGNFRFF